MNSFITLSAIVLAIAAVSVNCGPAPPVTQLYFHQYVYKQPNGYTKFYYYQKGYSERVYAYYNGGLVRYFVTSNFHVIDETVTSLATPPPPPGTD